ncbi:hypothetical protein G7062_07315 [Erysipelothrix sp. HDW6C]|uniref:hypothetical protein n=1 Tax=Erysipelothrix sp. HDW6C TaxID=2714930 RepID=UPI0014095244|nr:hypothetical protein [Erysipelothrix sp. HDW6C]QIK70104.1 hypothetical protein G7062_07315 [Erysipelothrix sp. HDW6C]
MALWQFSFDIIRAENIEMSKSDEGILDWKSNDITHLAIANIKNIFGIGQTWHKDLCVYGNLEKTHISIFRDDSGTSEISCRISLLEESVLKDVKVILSFINTIHGLILYEEAVYQADYDILIGLIRASNAAKFAVFGMEYFDQLKQH